LYIAPAVCAKKTSVAHSTCQVIPIYRPRSFTVAGLYPVYHLEQLTWISAWSWTSNRQF